jgi:hypothetical protein
MPGDEYVALPPPPGALRAVLGRALAARVGIVGDAWRGGRPPVGVGGGRAFGRAF